MHVHPSHAGALPYLPGTLAVQVEMVSHFIECARGRTSVCQQMIMGAGKTTVVGPLLVLCLADGGPDGLSVTQVPSSQPTCLPLSQPAFLSLRPLQAVCPDSVHKLNDVTSLNLIERMVTKGQKSFFPNMFSELRCLEALDRKVYTS